MQGSKKTRSTDCRRCGLACTSGERARYGDYADAETSLAHSGLGGGDRAKLENWSDRDIAGCGRGRWVLGVVGVHIADSGAESEVG